MKLNMNMDISKFKKCRVLVIGDLMIDEYLWGDVDRISPEAPVQVLIGLFDACLKATSTRSQSINQK